MRHILLTISLTLGFAFPAFAVSKAATVLEHGKIIYQEIRDYEDDNGETVYYREVLVAYENILYKCQIYRKFNEVECYGFKDRMAYPALD